MTIVLDGTPLAVETGGIRRYTCELARALAAAGDRVLLLSDQRLPAVNGLAVEGEAARGILGRRWWSIGLPRALARHGADLFHGTDFAVPYLPVRPSVLTLHDLSPWLNAEWHTGAARVRRRTPLLLRTGAATMVITPSEAVRTAAIDRFRLDPARVAAVREAAAPHFRPLPPARAEAPFLLVPGTVERRKNVGTAIEAWRIVREICPVRLVIAGRLREDAPALPEEPGVEYLGAVSDEDLVRLYSGAAATLYPSWYEGFGLPVLEAMQCGSPVVAGTDPAVRELSGGAALHADPGSPAAWAEAIAALLGSAELRRERAEAGIRRAAQFTWDRTARETREVYAEAIRRFRR